MYKRGAKGWAKHMDFILLDAICLELSLLSAFAIRHGWNIPFLSEVYANIAIVSLLISFFVCVLFDSMKNVLRRGRLQELEATIKHVIYVFVGMTVYMFTLKVSDTYSRTTIYLMVPIYIFLAFSTRVLWKGHLQRKWSQTGAKSLMILTSKESAPYVIDEIVNHNYAQYELVGVVLQDVMEGVKNIQDVPVVANCENMVEYINNNWVDEVLVYIKPWETLPEDLMDTLIAMGVTVHISFEKPTNELGVKQVIGNVAGLPVITNSMNYMTPRQHVVKRLIDIVGGLVGCVITGILYLILAPMIKKSSPGPAFFAQTRVGQNGKEFKFYKFRSMYLDAEERKKELMDQNRIKDGMMFKMEFDPRIIGNEIDADGNQKTGIGEFIRSTSLDEFPQFWNVLKGDMSLVGTRPPTVDEYEKYEAHHKARLAAKPGITGMWQISGRSNILDFEEVVRLDTEYINNWSIGLDIKILVRTIGAVLKRDGSM